jgi:anti-sigma factor RsiW
LPGASATDVATESAPASAPVLSASSTPAIGTVVLRTIPSGATVSVDGDTVPKSAGNHTLTVGQHLLEVESSSGEITLIPVTISAGKTLEICYNFDTNSACVN